VDGGGCWMSGEMLAGDGHVVVDQRRMHGRLGGRKRHRLTLDLERLDTNAWLALAVSQAVPCEYSPACCRRPS
jgi:hypothetical protein